MDKATIFEKLKAVGDAEVAVERANADLEAALGTYAGEHLTGFVIGDTVVYQESYRYRGESKSKEQKGRVIGTWAYVADDGEIKLHYKIVDRFEEVKIFRPNRILRKAVT
jgi:hypothetical protein